MITKDRIDNYTNRPFSELALDFENIIEHVFGEGGSKAADWAPRANVMESDTGYVVELELPGISSDEVNVELKDGILEVSGSKSMEPEEGIRLIKSERRTGTFGRKFKFTSQLDSEKISAEFKHGILTIDLPKSEKILPRKIDVKVAG